MISADRRVRILAESTWRPGEGSLDVPEVPALLRRRLSRLTRMTFKVALDCCRQAGVSISKVPVVFASRHGEMDVTMRLLAQLAEGATLSPMDFSGSVHHTAMGYLSIHAKNVNRMRAIAAGEESFCCGFLEAMGLLQESRSRPVLLIAADDKVPNPIGRWVGKLNKAYAGAFLLDRSAGQSGIRFTLHAFSEAKALSSAIPALQFARWVRSGKRVLDVPLNGKVWQWEK